MPPLGQMPQLQFDATELTLFGRVWEANEGALSRTPPYSSNDLGRLCNQVVANALATMLGGISVVTASSSALLPPQANCVETGEVRIIGGVRPQNFDVGYRPDGIRFAFDSKTLNDTKSVGKNWQNMVNDLATEAVTVHSRFPYAVVAFMVMIPAPCLGSSSTRASIIGTLERLGRRTGIDGPHHMAEAISLVVWHPDTGDIDPTIPNVDSLIRYENFSRLVEAAYTTRYKGLPPHSA